MDRYGGGSAAAEPEAVRAARDAASLRCCCSCRRFLHPPRGLAGPLLARSVRAWRRYERWLAREGATHVLASLRPGATEAALRLSAELLGLQGGNGGSGGGNGGNGDGNGNGDAGHASAAMQALLTAAAAAADCHMSPPRPAGSR